MTDIANDISSTIGRRIRSERALRDWSLAELAERSDVSKAMLSTIERGKTSPTAALLVRIASAFGMTLSTLIARAELQGGGLLRESDQPLWRDPATGYVRRHLSPVSDMPLELIRVQLPAGAKVSFPAASYAFIRQQIWLISGWNSPRAISFTVSNQVTALRLERRRIAPSMLRDRPPPTIWSRWPEAEAMARVAPNAPTMAGRLLTTMRDRHGARATPASSLPGRLPTPKHGKRQAVTSC
jgi:transcriptional regulator with XRE-family HTH domain